MGLPSYSGAFKVGVLDLEIPVRQPRSFCDNVLDPAELNKPARKARKWASQQNNEAKQSRQDKQRGSMAQDARVQSGDSNANASRGASSSSNTWRAATTVENDDERAQQETPEAWSPWSSGSKTCTLHLETVLFTLYYPTLPMSDAEEKKYPRAAWLGRPVHAGVQALLQYVGQYGLFAIPASPAVMKLVNARLPARVGPPLADPEELRRQAHPDRAGTDRAKAGNFGKRPPQFPLVIFSHGLAGNRLSYSQFCGELASQGIVVAAIEHRDGSGVSSIVRGEEAPAHADKSSTSASLPKLFGHAGSGRMKASVPYFTFETIGLQSFATEPNEREVNLRRDQIEMRHAEIDETLHVLAEINAGRGWQIVQRSTRNLGTKLAGHSASGNNPNLPANSLLKSERPLADWAGKLDLDFPTLCGHSFGGATVLELMRKPNPFPMAMVLDPWVEPVGDPAKDEDKVKGLLTKPVYVLNSESFTVWTDHFEKLKRICLDARKTSGRGWLLTLTGSKHTDFSDYPFLLPRIFRSTVGPRHTIEVFSKATYMQMGLSRQRQREKHDGAGYKVDRKGTLSDDKEGSAKPTGIGFDDTGSIQQVESPTKMVFGDHFGRQARSEIGRSNHGTGDASETAAVTSKVEKKHEEDMRANANALSAFADSDTANANDSGAQTSEADKGSCQQLRDDCRGDEAAGGQEGRDMVADRQRQASGQRGDETDLGPTDIRGFITDTRYLKMIDADQDVQQVHEQLEEISERLAYKKTRPRSLMSVFMYFNGLRPGLDKPGQVLIHQLETSPPPK